jgi:Chaperone for protein-folding within the ER, fungal
MNPMFLVYSPPQMLPTETLNPTSTSGPAATGKSRVKRGLEEGRGMGGEKIQQHMSGKNIIQQPPDLLNADKWWWVGVGMTALGTIMYMMPTST